MLKPGTVLKYEIAISTRTCINTWIGIQFAFMKIFLFLL